MCDDASISESRLHLSSVFSRYFPYVALHQIKLANSKPRAASGEQEKSNHLSSDWSNTIDVTLRATGQIPVSGL